MLENFARWCSGSTTVFGAVRVGSNPARVTYRVMGQWLGRLLWEQDIVKVRVLLTLQYW